MSSFSPAAVIFDFDGTLADSIPAICVAFNTALEPLLGRTFSREEVVARFGPTDQGMLAIELRDFAPEVLDAAIETYFAAYTRAQNTVVAFEGIENLISELHGRFPLGIMTGKSRRAADISLSHLGWGAQFGAIVAGDEVAHPKPAPDGPLLAAQQLGVEPKNCIYIGDSPADIGAARGAGMKSVAAGWHAHFLSQLRELSPDFWADHPADVLQFV
ncbi:MAG TPA: HAD family hydrolase [Abditibacterium sp.]